MLAACEYESAVLQWGYLSAADRAPVAAASGLPPAVVAGMEKSLVATNEIFSVAAALARRLGLQRLTPIDDQTDAAIFAEIVERLPGELEKIEEHPESRALRSSPHLPKVRKQSRTGTHSRSSIPLQSPGIPPGRVSTMVTTSTAPSSFTTRSLEPVN